MYTPLSDGVQAGVCNCHTLGGSRLKEFTIFASEIKWKYKQFTMKRILTIIFLIAGIQLSAQTVSLDEAQKAAVAFFGEEETGNRQLHTEVARSDEGLVLYYVVSYGDKSVVVAGDRNVTPVLAYFDNDGSQGDLVPPSKMWLDHYGAQIQEIKARKSVNTKAQVAWNAMLNMQSRGHRNVEEVVPFLTSKWGQGSKYNFHCPSVGRESKAVTGCVATALSQIVHYFRFPNQGEGSYTYEHEKYGVLSADFSKAFYDFDAMPDAPVTTNPAIGLLMHHFGVAVDMDYGTNASGMYNHKAAYALRTYFKFNPETAYVFRDSVEVNWDSLMVVHLQKQIPLYYAGWSKPHTDGHGFVCDGYQKMEDDRYYYHFNFGWDGKSDGYYYTEALSPNGANFNLAQEVIINGYPDTTRFTYPNPVLTGSKTLTAEAGAFDAGNGPIEPYSGNMDYTWYIEPEIDNLKSIDLKLQYEIAENDILYVTTDDPEHLSYEFTNESSALNLSLKATKITLRFKTSDGQGAAGFRCNYNSIYDRYCTSITIRASEGEVDDGSGEYNYRNCTSCRYSFWVNDVKYTTIRFNQFETEPDKDILYVYSENKELLMKLSGNLTGETYTFESGKIELVFETSAENTYPGWNFSYTTGNVDIDEPEPGSCYSVAPNPASDFIDIRLNASFSSSGNEKASLYDTQGRLLTTSPLEEGVTRINTSSLSSGIYLLRIGEAGRTETIKIIKQ